MSDVFDDNQIDELVRQLLDRPVPHAAQVRQAVLTQVCPAVSEIMTLAEVAAFLRLSERELMDIADELPAFELAGKVLVRRSRLLQWLEDREQRYAWGTLHSGRSRTRQRIVFNDELV